MTMIEPMIHSNRSTVTDRLTDDDALSLAEHPDLQALTRRAQERCFHAHGNVVSYSKKVFIPLTQLCRDVCHYCTFAQTPGKIDQIYLPLEKALEIARRGRDAGCKEALFTLGEKPELRYEAARAALDKMGFQSTLHYVAHVADAVLSETGLLPHINAGCMSEAELAKLRPVSASMGLMLESSSERLCQKGQPHFGSPDKAPVARLASLERAGRANVPMTTGILIGIGETRQEIIQSLLDIRHIHERFGHIQEVIIQNFRAKAQTKMATAAEPTLEDLQWSIAVARLIFEPSMNIQAPPNLTPDTYEKLLTAGINDWGGISPITPDHVNPEAPWPQLDTLAAKTAGAGRILQERMTAYPSYSTNMGRWLDPNIRGAVLKLSDSEGFARQDPWIAGEIITPPSNDLARIKVGRAEHCSVELSRILARAAGGQEITEADAVTLLTAKDDAFGEVCAAADQIRKKVNGDIVTYAVNRNINYTNICYFKCQFCAFSKGKLSENLRGQPYDLTLEEILRRCVEAWKRGATEVCLQGGIHPNYTGETYLGICRAIKNVVPDMHIHAFSPLEVWQGAATLGISPESFLAQLQDAGLGSLPGTAAEILDDDVRAIICPDKINTEQWLRVISAAHRLGLKTTATIMFGHVDRPYHVARHLLRIRDLQKETNGFTEMVPLPFVASQSPMYLKGKSRRGPTFRENVLVHAVARLVLHPHVRNIQASWVKLGEAGVAACLQAGVNDLGGTLMNESISKAAGASHGQELPPKNMEELIVQLGRIPQQRTTLYGDVIPERRKTALVAPDLTAAVNMLKSSKRNSPAAL